MMSDTAYMLFWDTSRVGDQGVTADLVEFPGSENVVVMLDRELAKARAMLEANTMTISAD